ncbi:MAG TPA: SRPBCC domain-containing protein [Gaiellaceae bacterium]|nr:SRPBCC domain-containing protein [Gaiellaceae bacterium]
MPRGRRLRLALLGLAGLVVLCVAALGASAALDRPARVVTLPSTVVGTKQEVWDTLTDFAAYEEWNPVVTEASGEAREGGELDLEVRLPGHDPESLEAKVLIFRPERKLRWQDRLVLPGVRDWEYEFVLEPVEGGHVRIVQLLRIEGLLAPFADTAAAREALELQAEALVARLAEAQR